MRRSAPEHRVAILYQSLPPPLIDGLRKDAKPGGYADSGADIAFALQQAGVEVITPTVDPAAERDHDWVYPDTPAGIAAALSAGATVFWANTVLFDGHPLARVMSEHWIVGQSPVATQRADDKFGVNAFLRDRGLLVARSLRVTTGIDSDVVDLSRLDEEALRRFGLTFPLIVKPVRGRGSQGVSLVRRHRELVDAVEGLVASGRFGPAAIVEEFLPGDELTVTVLPRSGPAARRMNAPQGLRPIWRLDHEDGVAPYNGLVPVTRNSRALTAAEAETDVVQKALDACVAATRLVDARAPVRIDCRAGADGELRLFDLNMKPNMTGAGRPGREDQDSLCTLAAAASGWSYADLLTRMLSDAWREPNGVLEHLP